jgi:tagatose-1,6-bisphosphate aldolase non-catalytic subunit AgaZ/GatZ
MGIFWESLSIDTKTKIENSLLSSAMNENQLSQFLSVCLLVNYEWWDRDIMENLIFQTLQRLYGEKDRIKYYVAPSFVKTMVTLGKRPFQWDLLPKEVQDSLRNAIELFAPVFTEQEFTDLSQG